MELTAINIDPSHVRKRLSGGATAAHIQHIQHNARIQKRMADGRKSLHIITNLSADADFMRRYYQPN
jgi:hypothetical protein